MRAFPRALRHELLRLRATVSYLPAMLILGFLVSSALAAGGQATPPKDKTGLQNEVLALLGSRCAKCHGLQKAKAKLTLVTLEGIARGSSNGPVVHPGKPADSPLWQMVQEGKMPPKSPLPETERSLIRRWIEQGSPGLSPTKTETASSHWAFRRLARGAILPVQHPEYTRTAIDRYIEAALEKNDLHLGP